MGRMEITIKRTVKDSVFCHLFSKARYALELYRSLHPKDKDTGEGDIEHVTIENIVSEGEYNDVGIMVGGRLLVLVEAQSTWSPNIVTRMLFYLSETYKRIVSQRKRRLYSPVVLEMPVPELYVVYTGDRDVPDVVRFSDVCVGREEGSLDLRVNVLRGGSPDVIGEYVAFAHEADEVRVDDDIEPEAKPRELMRRCKRKGILKEYLEQFGKEVEGIMSILFDQERETALYHEEIREKAEAEGLAKGRAEGLAKGLAKGVKKVMHAMGYSAEGAMDFLEIEEEERPAILELLEDE